MKYFFSSIQFKLTTFFLLFSLFPVVILMVFGTKEIENTITAFIMNRSLNEINIMTKTLHTIVESGNFYALDEIFKDQKDFYFSVTAAGDIYYLNGGKVTRPRDIETYIKTIKGKLESEEPFHSIDYANSRMISSVPFGDGSCLVRVMDLYPITRMSERVTGKIMLFMILSILMTTTLLSFMIYYSIGVPVKILTRAAKHISTKNFNISIDPDAMQGEFKTLSNAFIFASGELDKGIQSLNNTIEETRLKNEKIDALNRELLATSNRYREILNSSFVGIIIHDDRGNVIDANSTMIKMLGLDSKEEALAYTIYDYSGNETTPFEADLHMRRAIEGEKEIFEWVIRRPRDGSEFPVQVSLRQVSFDGEQDYIIANVIDITEQKRAEEKLIRSQKLETVGNLAGGLAHDFNNVLAGIAGPVSMIEYKLKKRGTVENDVLEKYLDNINSAVDRASGIVNQLLSISKKQSSNFELMDLKDSVRSVRDIAANSFDKTISISVTCYPEKALVMGDPSQIEQILLNLAVNAAHAMTFMRKSEENWGGNLTITVSGTQKNTGGYFAVSVEDTGVGIEQDKIKDIFSPFFTTKDPSKGTGIGLSMVHNLISLHGGSIEVHSEKGRGSRFTFYIPEAEKKEKAGDKSEDKGEFHIREKTGMILVIDDEEPVRKTLKDMLETAGYSVLTAENGNTGLEIFKERHDEVSAIILDMAMPEMSGKAVYPKLQEIDREVKVLFSSGFSKDERVVSVLKSGKAGFIQKPYSMQTLLRAVEKVIDGRF